ncbi:MAG: 16S rRNA processing protein RimM [Alphaproteobacteria bacterium]|nr:16S rRNA processing protein RimM [Alphaproteobacteria bacterium]
MSKTSKDLVVIGAIMGAHGVRGDVRVKSFTGAPDALFDYAPFLDEAGQVLLDPKSARPAKDHFIVTPVHPKQKEAWDALKGTRLHIPRARLPEPEEDEFYITELIGLTAQGEDGAIIGKVKAVLDHGAGDLLEIAPKHGGKSVLVPFTLADVPDVSLSAGTVTLATYDIWADDSPPEGEG